MTECGNGGSFSFSFDVEMSGQKQRKFPFNWICNQFESSLSFAVFELDSTCRLGARIRVSSVIETRV